MVAGDGVVGRAHAHTGLQGECGWEVTLAETPLSVNARVEVYASARAVFCLRGKSGRPLGSILLE